MRTKTVYRTLNVREALALAEAGVKGIEVKQASRTWTPPSWLYHSSKDDDDYICANRATVYRVAVE